MHIHRVVYWPKAQASDTQGCLSGANRRGSIAKCPHRVGKGLNGWNCQRWSPSEKAPRGIRYGFVTGFLYWLYALTAVAPNWSPRPSDDGFRTDASCTFAAACLEPA